MNADRTSSPVWLMEYIVYRILDKQHRLDSSRVWSLSSLKFVGWITSKSSHFPLFAHLRWVAGWLPQAYLLRLYFVAASYASPKVPSLGSALMILCSSASALRMIKVKILESRSETTVF
jgi:hypothetical protein